MCLYLLHRKFPEKPSVAQVAREAQVGWHFAKQVLSEIEEFGEMIDPEVVDKQQKDTRRKVHELDKMDAAFLVSLRAEDPSGPNLDCVNKLNDHHGKLICSTTISNF